MVTVGIEMIVSGLVIILVVVLDRILTKIMKLVDHNIEFVYICLFMGIGTVIVGVLELL